MRTPRISLEMRGSSHAEPEIRKLAGKVLDVLQKDITVIKISLENPTAQEHTEDYFRREGTRLLEMGRQLLRKNVTEETLFAAFDTYGESEISDHTMLVPYPVARYFTGTNAMKEIFFTMRDAASWNRLTVFSCRPADRYFFLLRPELIPSGFLSRSAFGDLFTLVTNDGHAEIKI